MSRELTDAEALAHYRDELNRTRKALKDMADHVNKFYFGGDLIDAEWVKDELYRILGERPTRRPSVEVTAIWGWSAVPAEVKLACQMLTVAWL